MTTTYEFDACDTIAIRDAERAVREKLAADAGASLEVLLRAAMGATRDHWLLAQRVPSDGRQLRAAIGGVVMVLGVEHPDARRLAAEHKALATLSVALDALSKGVPVDFEAMGTPEIENPVGILKLWREDTP